MGQVAGLTTACALPRKLSQPSIHAGLNVAKAVAAQMLAAIPARDDDDLAGKFRPLKHSHDHQASPRLAVVTL